MSGSSDLADVRNHLFNKSENRWWLSFYLTAGMQLLLLLSMIWNHPIVVYVTGFGALVLPLAVTWIREWAASFSGKGDKVRRVILYADSLGENIPPQEKALIRGWTEGADLAPVPYNPPYFFSTLPAGPARLADNVCESAFFTMKLSEIVKRHLTIVLLASGLILFGILYFGLISAKGSGNSSQEAGVIANIVLATASFILGGDILVLRKKYAELRDAASGAYEQCARLREKPDVPLFEVMQPVEDYNIALTQSPPVPFCLYKKHRDFLNGIYRSSHSRNSDGQ
ncbi:MAG: hypothetical protein V2I97_01190 [Desulfococcaceae bacterium]|jgi:hypothetical protein|nr:hypothetical protein [Desulfococcaceae bacterium]